MALIKCSAAVYILGFLIQRTDASRGFPVFFLLTRSMSLIFNWQNCILALWLISSDSPYCSLFSVHVLLVKAYRIRF
jgi:hypothetical protein